MSIPTTLLTVFFHPEQEEQVLYHLLTEMFAEDETAYTILDRREEQLELPLSNSSHLPHTQRQLTFVMRDPLDKEYLKSLGQWVITGLLYGFLVKGEICLGDMTYNNLIPFGAGQRRG